MYSPNGYLSSKVPEVFQVPKIDFTPLMQMETAKNAGKSAAKSAAKDKEDKLSIDGLIGDDLAHYEAMDYANTKMAALLRKAGGDASLLMTNPDYRQHQEFIEAITSPQVLNAISQKKKDHESADTRLKAKNYGNVNVNLWKGEAPNQMKGSKNKGLATNGEVSNLVKNKRGNINAKTGEIDLNDKYAEAFNTEIDTDIQQVNDDVIKGFNNMGITEIENMTIGSGGSSIFETNIGENIGLMTKTWTGEKGGDSYSNNFMQVMHRQAQQLEAQGLNEKGLQAIRVNLLSNISEIDGKSYVAMPNRKRFVNNQAEEIESTEEEAKSIGGLLKDGRIYIPVQKNYTPKDDQGNPIKNKDGKDIVYNVNSTEGLDVAAMIYGNRMIDNMARSVIIDKKNGGKNISRSTSSFSKDDDATKANQAMKDAEQGMQEDYTYVAEENVRLPALAIKDSDVPNLMKYFEKHPNDHPQNANLLAQLKANGNALNTKIVQNMINANMLEGSVEDYKVKGSNGYSVTGRFTPIVTVAQRHNHTSVATAEDTKKMLEEETAKNHIMAVTEDNEDFKANKNNYVKTYDNKYMTKQDFAALTNRTAVSVRNPLTGGWESRRVKEGRQIDLSGIMSVFGTVTQDKIYEKGMMMDEEHGGGYIKGKNLNTRAIGKRVTITSTEKQQKEHAATLAGQQARVMQPVALRMITESKDPVAAFNDFLATIEKANPAFDASKYKTAIENKSYESDNLKHFITRSNAESLRRMEAKDNNTDYQAPIDKKQLQQSVNEILKENKQHLIRSAEKTPEQQNVADLMRLETTSMYDPNGNRNLGINDRLLDDGSVSSRLEFMMQLEDGSAQAAKVYASQQQQKTSRPPVRATKKPKQQ